MRLGISDDWILTHRVDLHNTLRETAGRVVDGRRVNIRLKARVASVVSFFALSSFFMLTHPGC